MKEQDVVRYKTLLAMDKCERDRLKKLGVGLLTKLYKSGPKKSESVVADYLKFYDGLEEKLHEYLTYLLPVLKHVPAF